MFKKIKAFFVSLYAKLFGSDEPEHTPGSQAPEYEAHNKLTHVPNPPPNTERPQIPANPPEPVVEWPVIFDEDDLGEPLAERPADGIAGWEYVKTFIGGQLPHIIVRWRDPESGTVRWVDKPPQLPKSMDWYYVASGVVDVTLPVWNFLWSDAEKIDTMREEAGLQRIREYKNGLRSNPGNWPEPFRSAYLDSH